MNIPRGGWSDGPQAKPASEYAIKYGHGLLKQESSRWPRYTVVTTPSAYEAARPHLGRQPAGVGYARWLDWTHLQEITDGLPGDAELVVGLGGGTALDASKYVALKLQKPLVLVPTIVSTGAIIHGVFARWEGRKAVGDVASWPWFDFEDILVDYDVVLKAPDYLNTAGLGDVLCGYAALSEWRRNSRLGVGQPFDEDAVAVAVGHHRSIVAGFPPTLAKDGGLTAESVRFIMTAVQERDSKSLKHPAAPGGDHVFWIGLEEVNNKGWVHGEAVAMAAVVIAWHCGESPETLVGRLDTCKVRWRPGEIGISRDELRIGLEFAPGFMLDPENRRDVNSILRNDPLVGARFDALWAYLDSA